MEKPTLAELKAELDQLAKKISELEKPKKTAKERWEEERDNELKKMNYRKRFDIYFYDENHEKLWSKQTDLMVELQTFAKLRNGDWVADWEDKSVNKYGIYLEKGKCLIDRWWSVNYLVYGISFKSAEIATEALEIFGERIEQFYGK